MPSGNTLLIIGVEITAPLLLSMWFSGWVRFSLWLRQWVCALGLTNESLADGHMSQAEPVNISPGTFAGTLGKKCFSANKPGKDKPAAVVAILACLRFESIHRKSDSRDGERHI